MSGIRFLTNTCWRDAAKIVANNPLVISGDRANCVGGPLYTGAMWRYVSPGGPTRITFGYLKNEDYTLVADACAWVGGASTLRATTDNLVEKHDAGGFTTIDTNEAPSSWNVADDDILVGPDDDDLFFTFTEVDDVDAIFFSPTSTTPSPIYNEWASKIYFGKSVLWEFPAACTIESFDDTVVVDGQAHEVERIINLTFEGVTRSDIDAFEDQYRVHEQPVCIYDDVGNRFWEKLVMGLIGPLVVTPLFDDLFLVQMQIQGLKRYTKLFR